MKQKLIYFLVATLFICSCKKYLDELPDKKLAVPQSLIEFQQLLDNNTTMIQGNIALGELGADNYYLPYTFWQSRIPTARNSFIWATDIFEGTNNSDWENAYKRIYISNVVLDEMKNIEINESNIIDYNLIKGTALFYRALNTYLLEETFGNPYKPSSSGSDLGIPLKLTSNFTEHSERASVETVYEQIINDLLDAKELLPNNVQIAARNRPCRPAAFALMARVYLTMQDYKNAANYTDSCLILYNTLLDYNNQTATATSSTVAISATRPFSQAPNDNIEVLFQAYMDSYGVLTSTTTIADTLLYSSYNISDLRKSAFYHLNTTTNTRYFKGHYTGLSFPFSGIATNEVYLIKAECLARLGQTNEAMNTLNILLKNRWKAGLFNPLTAANSEEALLKILQERRKELVFRGLRWIDLRRLNQDNRFAITLTRQLNGQIYTLEPGNSKYVYPIPDNEIQLSGFQQNQR
jgi:hypothetical protein